jgi:uncharacterized phiE125 gp8 family phage protein
MKFEPVLVTAPATTPVSVAECKTHLRVTHSADDTYIGACLAAAVGRLDGHAGILGRCLITQTWKQPFSCWPVNRVLRLPFPNVAADSVVVGYLDTVADEQAVPEAEYEVLHDALGGFVYMRSAFTAPSLEDDRAAPVWVEFDAGFGDAEDVPAPIKAAILLMVGDLYENREDTVVGTSLDVRPLPRGVDALLAPYRRVRL